MDNQSNSAEDNKPDLMGYENQVPTAPETTLPETSNATDVQSIINQAVKEVTVDDNGKYVYPKDMDPMLKAAVAATKSYRDNQSGFTKSQQTNKELEAEAQALRQKLAEVTKGHLELTQEERVELDNLKNTDPEAWRVRLNDIESESKQAIQEELDTVTEEARKKTGAEFELDRRYKVLEEFNEGREVEITPELLDSDIPPRITKKLAEGKVTFEEYLVEASEYLDKGKVVASPKTATSTNLNNVGGSGSPEGSNKEDGVIDYSTTTL